VTIADRKGIIVVVQQPTIKKGNNKAIPNQVDFLISQACLKAGISKLHLSAIGVGSCSPFSKRGKHITVICPTLCGGLKYNYLVRPPNRWTEIPLEHKLSGLNPGCKIKIMNDAVVGVVAERLFGSAAGEDNLAYVTWSTGIGTGAYVDGHLLQGKNCNAPHGGHMLMSNEEYATIESLSSGTSIAKSFASGIKGKSKIIATDVVVAYQKGDKKAKKIIINASRAFARGLASIAILLDTQVFIVGGGVMRHKDVLLPLVKKEFYKCFPAMTAGVKITASSLSGFVSDLGALALVMPESWIKEWRKKKPWKKCINRLLIG
jgi:glucokinase